MAVTETGQRRMGSRNAAESRAKRARRGRWEAMGGDLISDLING